MVDDKLSAQASVLGALLIDPSLVGGTIRQLRDTDFSSAPCRMVWQTIKGLWERGQKIDPVIVRDNLTGFDNATAFLVELMDITPTTANLDYYISAVRRQAAMEALRQIGADLQGAETLEQMTQLIAKANGLTVQRGPQKRMTAEELLKSFAADHASGVEPEYIPWAFDALNRKVYAEFGDMVVLAGRPSDGKTALALVNAWHQAKTYRVGFYSLETGCKKIRDRSLAAMIGIDMDSIKHNRLDDRDWERYAARSGDIAGRNFTVVEAAGMTVDDIFSDAIAEGYQVIYIDYMQLIRPTNPRETNRVQAVTDISLRIHQQSRSAGITTVALAQVNRSSVEGGKTRRPSMSDLRESGQIEQDADCVMFIWRQSAESNVPERKLFVAKNKEGEIGEFDLLLQGKYQSFTEDTRPKMPDNHKKTRQTPVIGDSYREITGPDPQLPF